MNEIIIFLTVIDLPSKPQNVSSGPFINIKEFSFTRAGLRGKQNSFRSINCRIEIDKLS